jgi:hypothetical protein
MIPEAAMKMIAGFLGFDVETVTKITGDMQEAARKIIAQQQEILDTQRQILQELQHARFDQPIGEQSQLNGTARD